MRISQEQQVIIGGVMIATGMIFGFLTLTGASLFSVLWPMLIIIPGLFFLYPALQGQDNVATAPLAVPGWLIVGTGLILMYQNITGHWESWAYVWVLYGVFLGLGLHHMGRSIGDELESIGSCFIRFSLIGFAVLALFFELIIFGRGMLFTLLISGLLVLGGLWLLSRTDGPPEKPKRKRKNDELPGLQFVVESQPDSSETH